jgi:alkanesulfonate monooxygenase SsuD/methylene tetrahydromethanopterin reductase-like flavin-dependent oxidoreductase (luciferase family)
MRNGLYLPPFGPFGEPTVLVDLAQRAEAAGWDGVFLWDHLVTEHLPIVDTWTTLGAIAHATSRLVLGATVTPLPRRRPWVVARQAATVSRLSGGRLVLGAGLGSDEGGDFSRFGEPASASTHSAMLDEGLDIVRAMWAGRAFEHRGPHYSVTLEEAPPEPHPIPVWIASSGSHPNVIRRAARADGIFPISDHLFSPSEIEALLKELDEAGRPADAAYDVIVAGNASHAWPEPHEVDLASLSEAGVTWWMESLIHFDPLELSLEVVDAGPTSTAPSRSARS